MFNLFKKKSPELAFTQKFLELLQAHVKGIKLEKLEELQVVVNHESGTFTHNLDNAWAERQLDPSQEADVLARFTKAAVSLYQPDTDFEPSRIVPIVKGVATSHELISQLSEQNDPYVWEEYTNALSIFYALDQDDSIRYLKQSELNALGIPLEDLRDLAVGNLLNLIPDMERQGEDGYYMLTAGGNYEASLLLADSIWNQENFPVDGELVTAIPARDVLLITGSNHKEGIDQMRKAVEDIYFTGSYSVSPELFVFKEGRFEALSEEA
ncbi:hypothetical protein MASR2M44_12340 [Bacteroidota bacterium]